MNKKRLSSKPIREVRRLFYFAGGSTWVMTRKPKSAEKIGSEYGGWWILPEYVNQSSVVYGVGVGKDLSWDLAMTKRFGCRLHAFDPTPRSLEWIKAQKLPREINFKPWGLAEFDGTLQLHSPPGNFVSYSRIPRNKTEEIIECPVYRLLTIMSKLGHDKIDVLKIDIEGSEYQVIEDLIQTTLFPKQLLVEFHHNFSDISTAKTKKVLSRLRSVGYRVFASSFRGLDLSLVHEAS